MIDSLSEPIALLAALSLGLAAGALLTEGAVLVPFWRSLEPAAFLDWYRRNGSLLLRFFGPLEVVPTVLVFVAAGFSYAGGLPGSALLAFSSVLAIGVLASFPLYFRAANESFATGTVALDDVGAELRRWSLWHWFRTAIAIAAFVAALLAVVRAGGST